MFQGLIWVKNFNDSDEGQDLVEYSLLLAFVAVASVATVIGLSDDISALWTAIANRLASTD